MSNVAHKVEFELLHKAKYATACPKCIGDRSNKQAKSLMVYRDPDGFDRYECMHPGCEWNERQFIKRVDEIMDIQEKAEDVAIPVYMDVPDHINGHKVWWYRSADGGVLYGKKRIDLETPEGERQKKTYRPVRIVNGEVVDQGMSYPKNKELYNLPDVSKFKKVIVVEGEKAAEAGKAKFSQAAVVTWSGGAHNISQADWEPLMGKDIYLWPDNDSDGTGLTAMKRIGELLPAIEYKILKVDHLPNKSDLADNLTKEDIDTAFREATLVDKLGDGRMNKARILKQLDSLGTQTETGLSWIDESVMFPASGIVVVEGRTGHGKTAFAVNVTRSMLTLGKKVLYLSYEVPAWEIVARHVRVDHPEESLNSALTTGLADGILEHTDKNLVIFDQDNPLDIDALVKLLDNDGWYGATVVIDNIQLVPLKGADRFQSLKRAVEKLRDVSHRRGIVVLLLSQLTPNENNPLADNPRESKEIHNTASVVLRIWNKEEEPWNVHPIYEELAGNFYVQVAKNRNGHSKDVMALNLVQGGQIQFLQAFSGKDLKPVRKKKKEDDEVTKSDMTKMVKALTELTKALMNQHEAF